MRAKRKNSINMMLENMRIFTTMLQGLSLKKRFSAKKGFLRPVLLAVLATASMIFICAVSYGSIRTNASSGFKYYTSVTVENGETLWDIADEYVDYNYYKNKNSYITEVQRINHLDENCCLVTGQTIILPYYSSQYIY